LVNNSGVYHYLECCNKECSRRKYKLVSVGYQPINWTGLAINQINSNMEMICVKILPIIGAKVSNLTLGKKYDVITIPNPIIFGEKLSVPKT
jgi:hypothetical protein